MPLLVEMAGALRDLMLMHKLEDVVSDSLAVAGALTY